MSSNRPVLFRTEHFVREGLKLMTFFGGARIALKNPPFVKPLFKPTEYYSVIMCTTHEHHRVLLCTVYYCTTVYYYVLLSTTHVKPPFKNPPL